jgi:hypothetical protein
MTTLKKRAKRKPAPPRTTWSLECPRQRTKALKLADQLMEAFQWTGVAAAARGTKWHKAYDDLLILAGERSPSGSMAAS